jgi:uncharacterized protein (UPF0332 family)
MPGKPRHLKKIPFDLIVLIMSLLEKSGENKRVAEKCLSLKAYNAGVSRAYYAAFQRADHFLSISGVFDYGEFLERNRIERQYIPHGKMKQAIAECLLKTGKAANLAKITIFDNLYHKRRKADYTDTMYGEDDLKISISDLEVVLAIIA